jgi:hypothetical protein
VRSSGAGESRRQGKQRRGQSQVEDTRPHTHAGDALRQLTMHISTNDLHCCKPARLAYMLGDQRVELKTPIVSSRVNQNQTLNPKPRTTYELGVVVLTSSRSFFSFF